MYICIYISYMGDRSREARYAAAKNIANMLFSAI